MCARPSRLRVQPFATRLPTPHSFEPTTLVCAHRVPTTHARPTNTLCTVLTCTHTQPSPPVACTSSPQTDHPHTPTITTLASAHCVRGTHGTNRCHARASPPARPQAAGCSPIPYMCYPPRPRVPDPASRFFPSRTLARHHMCRISPAPSRPASPTPSPAAPLDLAQLPCPPVRALQAAPT